MKYITLFKSLYREFLKTFLRFFSIFAITLLGVSSYVGIASTGPDMILTANTYFDDYKLADYRLLSTQGFTQDDINVLNENGDYSVVMAGYGVDVLIENNPVRLHSIPNDESDINKIDLLDGRMPENDNEILADSESQSKIGDKITISNNNSEQTLELLHEKEFTVVGIVQWPYYIYLTRGYTNIGDGQLDSFYLVPQDAFSSPYYLEVFLREKKLEGLDTFSNEYKTLQDEGVKNLEEIAYTQTQLRYDNLLKEIEEQQKLMLENSALHGEILQENSNESNIEQQIPEPQKAQWIIQNRSDQPGFNSYYASIERLEQLSVVFPLFFFLVATLICLTTMTRMVDEKRQKMGLLKALGYTNKSIALEYLFYGIFASFLGALAGGLIGTTVFPLTIWHSYDILCNMPSIILSIHPIIFPLSILVAVTCITVATLVACIGELKSVPSSLMQPKAPKIGKKILLERVKPIWKNFNFIQKITARNIFRYKKRLYMTVLGVAGCTALLLAGFGLGDSINKVMPLQFEDIFNYDASILLSSTDNNDETNTLNDLGESLYVHNQAITLNFGDKSSQSAYVYLIVPKNNETINNFINLKDVESSSTINLDDDNGIIITEKIANIISANVGDRITIHYKDKELKNVLITDITQNYFNHYVYMTSNLFKDLTDSKATYETVLFKSNDDITKDANSIIESDNVNGIIINNEIEKEMYDMMQGLNSLVILSVVSAILLAVVVMYNLINLNITERTREIATLKVLGFNKREFLSYIYRESFYLSIAGIALGILLGVFLLDIMLKTAEITDLLFIHYIAPQSYVLSIIFTIASVLLVDLLVLKRLLNIKCTDSLNSNE